MNNIIKKTAFLFISTILAIFAFREFFGSANSVTYRIFERESKGYYLHKLLGIVPSDYQDRYSKTVLDFRDQTKMILFSDDFVSSHPHFIVLTSGDKTEFLKNHPFGMRGKNDEKNQSPPQLGPLVSQCIDLEIFNKYVKAKGFGSKQEIIESFCHLLSNPADRSLHRILSDTTDVRALIADRSEYTEFMKALGVGLVAGKDLDFDQPDTVVHCWFADKGIIKLTFSFNHDQTVRSVDSDFIGYLGIEQPSI